MVALAGQAMDEVRTSEWRSHPQAVTEVFGDKDSDTRKGLMWGMRKNPQGWTAKQAAAMHWLQRSHLQSARAWRMKMGLREVYARAREHNDAGCAQTDLKRWLGWARRSRLKPFMRLAKTITEHFDGMVRGMLDNRSNAYVETMNGLLQQVKRAARGFRTAKNFIAIAHLRMGRLKDLPQSPFKMAAPRGDAGYCHA